ncbi:MAG: acetyl-CoA hydrolase, partial [Anaerovoracaceae bacterium]
MENLQERLRSEKAEAKLMSAEEAAAIIQDGMVLGVSGFTPSGYPKAIPLALAERAKAGEKIKVDIYSGASVGPEIDHALTEADVIGKRLPYQTNATIRDAINKGEVDYIDMHLSQSPQFVNSGFIKKPDIAIVEGLAITEDGHIIPTSGIGNSPTFVRAADKVLVEINLAKPMAMEGMADIILTDNPPNRKPIE